MNFEILNFYVTIAGWLAWNFILFRIEKDPFDEKDQDFPLWKYIKRTYDNWLASAGLIPILLWIGTKGLSLDPLAEHIQGITWNDLYYVLSGFITEVVIYAYKKWKKKKQAEL